MADEEGAAIASSAPTTTASTSSNSAKGKNKPVCRFYNTKNGCRAGKNCKFRHPSASEDKVESSQSSQAPTPTAMAPEASSRNVQTSAESRVVARPVPKAQTEDPRKFQISQIERRYKPTVSEHDGSTNMSFSMKPSDPDFPYEIDELECVLTVPAQYPKSAPSLVVKNKEIPRGFQINIEKGFDTIATSAPGATLLNMMNRLDRQLETILSGQMAETVKIVSNKATPKTQQIQQQASVSQQPNEQLPETKEAFTSIQRDEARMKRQMDIRQLEARFGRLQSYAKSSDGLTYTLPIDSPKRSTWPAPLQGIKFVRLVVPEEYPLEPPELKLDKNDEEARAVEKAFRSRAVNESNSTLTQQINYLSQHVKDMAITEKVPKFEQQQPAPIPAQDAGPSEPELRSSTTDSDKPHIQYITRPPEWDDTTGSGSEDDSATEESDEGTGDENEGDVEEPEGEEPGSSKAPVERGILLSFPHLELHGIELLELVSLNITVKCERCKDTMDIERLRNATEDSKVREASCKKCATTFGIRFRADLIHANSVRGGYLDLDACTVVDMLPSQCIPTCSECSTAYPAPGVSAVRGDAAMAICRECHRKMTLRIQEVKFLQVSASAVRASRAPGRKKTKENLGITAGTELPRQGRCSHYRKSYRWFRFSCCNRVFACDRCHDEQTDHPNEHANRMICGFCSREQNYRPEDCGICHGAVTGKKGRGFWEGGKGTRERAKMSKKDPRKYKRLPGSKPKQQWTKVD